MSLNIPSVPLLSTPPSKADPVNFSPRADTFLLDLFEFGIQLNAVIAELNKITSGLDQQTPIAVYNSLTTYSFPDVVACTDGYSYRCVDTNVIGINPVTDDGTKWVPLAKPLPIDKLLIIGNAGTSQTLNTSVYDTFTFTCDQATLDLSSTTLALGRTVSLVITGADNCVITWPSGAAWPGGSAPSFSSGTDRVVLQRVSPTVIHAILAGAAYA